MVGRAIPSTGIRQIYSMGVSDLVTSIKSAASTQIDLPKYWDALLYRSSVLSDQLTPSHISSILNSFTVFPKYNSNLFFKFLLEKHFPIKPHIGASVSDLTMIMHAIEKLEIFSPIESHQYWHNFISPILTSPDKIKPSLSGTDMYRIARMACRFEDREVQNLLVGQISNSFDKYICTPQLATLMFDLFVPKSTSQDDEEPFFSLDSWESVNYPFLTKLMNKALSFSPEWNSRDIVSFASGFSRIPQTSLTLLGHPNSVAIQNLVNRRIQANLVQLKISQLLSLFEVVDDHGSVIINELIYRVRELKPKNCIKLVRPNLSSNHSEAIFTRLLKHDVSLTSHELLILTKSVARCALSRVGRQVVANQLSNLKSVNLVEWLPLLASLNIKLDTKKLEKLVCRNKTAMMKSIGDENIGSVALSLAKLGIFEYDFFPTVTCPPIELEKFFTAIAITDLAKETSSGFDMSNMISRLDDPSSLVRLLMIKLGCPLKFSTIPDPLKALHNVIFCPISSSVILVHVESFAGWLDSGRPLGESLIRQFSEIEPNEFVAIQLIDPIVDYFVPLLDQEPGQLNAVSAAQDKFVCSQFVTLKSFDVSSTADLVDHTIQELASLEI